MQEHGQLAAAERALADGRIGHLGFSFHGSYEDFEQVLAATDLWEFVQIQLNYMDEDYQAGRRGLELAAGKGLGVIVMEPVRGGASRATCRRRWRPRGTRRRSSGARPSGRSSGSGTYRRCRWCSAA